MSGQSTGHQWYTARDGKQTGPMSDVEIQAIARMGYFRDKDLVWRAGFADWQTAFSVFPPQPVAPPPPPLPVSQPAPVAAPVARTEPVAPAPQPIAVAVQPAPAPEQRPMAGLFNVQPTPPAPLVEPAAQHAAPVAAPSVAAPSPATIDTGQWSAQPAAAPRQAEPQFDARPAPARVEPAPLKPLFTPTEPQRLPLSLPRGLDTTARTQPPRELPARETTARPTAGGLQPTYPAPEPEAVKPRRHRMAMTALFLTCAAAVAGVWIAAGVGTPSLQSIAAVTKSIVGAGVAGKATAPSSDLEARLQQTVHWPVIKREFPDWYGERLREAAKLKGENKSDVEIAKAMTEQMVVLRRQNANLALSASTPKLKLLATTFLDNLRQLKSQSIAHCFSFISQGEMTPGVVEQLQVAAATPSMMQLQVAAIFDAIGEGRKSPVVHEKPQKADYDVLMTELGKLGWTQNDVAVFADPKALARAEPARVCQMVQDWFVAHIAIADGPTQERLLGETLRPVVSG